MRQPWNAGNVLRVKHTAIVRVQRLCSDASKDAPIICQDLEKFDPSKRNAMSKLVQAAVIVVTMVAFSGIANAEKNAPAQKSLA